MMDRRAMATLAGGHLCADSCQGAVPALLPFLHEQRGWSFAALSGLVLAATVSSSVIQPLFGAASDRRSLPWLMPSGVLVAGLGIALAGVAPSYGLAFAAIVLSGLGVAAFHPEGSRYANYVSGERQATGMSLFSVGGNLGFAVGAILVTPVVIGLGLAGTPLLVILPAAMALVLALELPRLVGFRARDTEQRAARNAAAGDAWAPFARLGGTVAFRSLTYFGLMTFVPLYLVNHEHASVAQANTALAVMLASGALGTLVGGRAADRFGRRTVLLVSLLPVTPLILAVTVASSLTAQTVLLGLVGAFTVSSFSVTVVMGQEYLPSRIGIASGVTLGLSIGVGGLAAPLLGLLADARGLPSALYAVAFLPLGGVLLALTLPARRRGASLAVERPASTAAA